MRTKGTKFLTYHQNNSGGYYLIDDNVKHYVIIEGYDLWQIEAMANSILSDYREYCSCCGRRWSSYFDDEDLTEEPMICNKSVYEYVSYWSEQAIIYYLDGTIEVVDIKERAL